MATHLDTGKNAEIRAWHYLKAKGLTLIQQNFRSSYGEIDLIMQHHTTLVFVEVRYRKCSNFGQSLETVGHRKQQRLIKTALTYLQQNQQIDQACRFDVLAFDGEQKINWIKNAFTVKY